MKQNIGKIIAVVLVVALCTVFFAACVPSDYSKAEANLNDNGYNPVVVNDNDTIGSIAVTAIELSMKVLYDINVNIAQRVSGVNKDGDFVTIYYFNDADSAKAYYNAIKGDGSAEKELKRQYDEGEITKEQYENAKKDMSNYKVGKFGKVVWSGTKAGVKAAN